MCFSRFPPIGTKSCGYNLYCIIIRECSYISNYTIGKKGEDLALRYFVSKGFTLVARNVLCGRFGEIDLVVRKENLLVFAEVKTRLQLRFGYPENAVTPFKRLKMLRCAGFYVRKFGLNLSFRIDVVSLVLKEGRVFLRHYSNITGF